MSRMRLYQVLILAAVLAIGFAAGRYWKPPPVEMVGVVVAAQDIPSGTNLTDSHLKVVCYAKGAEPAYTLDTIDGLPGLTAIRAFAKGQPITIHNIKLLRSVFRECYVPPWRHVKVRALWCGPDPRGPIVGSPVDVLMVKPADDGMTEIDLIAENVVTLDANTDLPAMRSDLRSMVLGVAPQLNETFFDLSESPGSFLMVLPTAAIP